MRTDNSKTAVRIKNEKQSIINTITWGIYDPETQKAFSKTYFKLTQVLLNLDFYSLQIFTSIRGGIWLLRFHNLQLFDNQAESETVLADWGFSF